MHGTADNLWGDFQEDCLVDFKGKLRSQSEIRQAQLNAPYICLLQIKPYLTNELN